MDRVAAIRRLYFKTTASSVQRDLARAIELFKALTTEAERERAAVYMDGLSQMRSEWARESRARPPKPARSPKRSRTRR